MSIAQPHGGKLVKKVIEKKDIESLDRFVNIEIDFDTALDVENIAYGIFSPLEGFCSQDDFLSILHEKRLTSGIPWTIPVILPVKTWEKEKISKKSSVVLTNGKINLTSVLYVQDIYNFNKEKMAEHVFGTKSLRHPGVAHLEEMGDFLVEGSIELVETEKYKRSKYKKTPEETRKVFEERAWKTIAGFQTRNVIHRAHEYLQRVALELVDGVFLQPIIGWKKEGDFDPDIVMKAYEIMIRSYYPTNRVYLSGLSTWMRYAGPREAVFHAIIRKNFGCTHFIVGRDHAGVGDFYDLYAAHKIFDEFDDLGIEPLLLNGPFYCSKCNGIATEKTCSHSNSAYREEISGTKIRTLITNGEIVPENLMRKEISDFLIVMSKKQNIFNL